MVSSPRINICLNLTVKSMHPSPNPSVSVMLTNGECLPGDLIVGADGIKNIIRQVVVGRPDHAQLTINSTYRAIIPTDVMLNDPDLKPFVDTPEMTAWTGPCRHLMAYCIVSLR